jgi:hypothetical protein
MDKKRNVKDEIPGVAVRREERYVGTNFHDGTGGIPSQDFQITRRLPRPASLPNFRIHRVDRDRVNLYERIARPWFGLIDDYRSLRNKLTHPAA